MMRPLDTTCSSYLRYQRCYRCAMLKPGSSLDPVNLLSLCFGYCSPIVQWDCNNAMGLKSKRSASRIREKCTICHYQFLLYRVSSKGWNAKALNFPALTQASVAGVFAVSSFEFSISQSNHMNPYTFQLQNMISTSVPRISKKIDQQIWGKIYWKQKNSACCAYTATHACMQHTCTLICHVLCLSVALLIHTALYCGTLHHPAANCNTLQHTNRLENTSDVFFSIRKEPRQPRGYCRWGICVYQPVMMHMWDICIWHIYVAHMCLREPNVDTYVRYILLTWLYVHIPHQQFREYVYKVYMCLTAHHIQIYHALAEATCHKFHVQMQHVLAVCHILAATWTYPTPIIWAICLERVHILTIQRSEVYFSNDSGST